MKNIRAFADKTAVSMSLLCAIHCLAMPVVVSLLPAIAGLPFADEAFHFLDDIGCFASEYLCFDYWLLETQTPRFCVSCWRRVADSLGISLVRTRLLGWGARKIINPNRSLHIVHWPYFELPLMPEAR